jgi:urease accessory protein
VAASALQQPEHIFAANRAVGHLALSVKAALGASRRADVHESGPLRVRCPGPPSPELEAVIVNTAGGIAGGDRLALDIAVGTDAALVVTSAAAEKVYRTTGPDAEIAVTLKVAAGGRLAWLPQETILFDRTCLRRTIDVDLADDGELLLAEAVVFGRADMGERVEQGRLLDRWRVRRSGRLGYAESLRLEGAIADTLRARAVAKEGIAVATVLAVPGDDALAERVRALSEEFRGEVGVSAWNGIAVARFCAPDGACLRHDLMRVLTALRGRALPRLWMN